MSALGLIIGIALPIALILVGVVAWGRRKQNQQNLRMRSRVIRDKAEELQDTLEFLIRFDDFRDIQFVLLDRVDYLHQLAIEQLPAQEKEQIELFDKEHWREKIEATGDKRSSLANDREIRLAKQEFSRALKALGAMVKQKQLSQTALEEYRRHLKLLLLDREVNTYQDQGDLAAERGDLVSAGNYYKAARKLLVECEMQFPEKNDRIRDLTQRSSALFNGGVKKEDKLANSMAKEEQEAEPDAHGLGPEGPEKKKF